MSEPVRVACDGHVASVTLSDPERRNSLSPELVDALVAKLTELGSDREVRCIVLTGEGTAFSAGGNPKRMLDPDLYLAMSPAELRDFYRDGIQRLPLALAALELPVIAAVNGPAIGAGCDLACLCDIRIASADATFAASFVKLGLVPGDGGAWILPRATGMAAAMEMMLTGDTVDAERALRLGIVSEVVPAAELLGRAGALARRIAANPPVTVRLTKRLAQDCARLDMLQALDHSAATQALSQKTEDHLEAVRAFMEKRAPRFSGK